MNHRARHLFYTFRCPKCNLRPQVGTLASLISYPHTNHYILQALLLWDPVGISVNSSTNHLSHKLMPAFVRSPIFPTLQKSASFCWTHLLVGTQFLKRVSAHCTMEKSNFLTWRRFLCSGSYLPIPSQLWIFSDRKHCLLRKSHPPSLEVMSSVRCPLCCPTAHSTSCVCVCCSCLFFRDSYIPDWSQTTHNTSENDPPFQVLYLLSVTWDPVVWHRTWLVGYRRSNSGLGISQASTLPNALHPLNLYQEFSYGLFCDAALSPPFSHSNVSPYHHG